MSHLSNYSNELKAAEAFSKQAVVFDEQYGADAVVRYKRSRVRDHVLRLLPAQSSVLELNCGTGEDALFFASRRHRVHATDVSEGMLRQLSEKRMLSPFGERVTQERCSFNQLEALQNKGPFDFLFSNFGGLNCTGELERVLASFHTLVKPGGLVTLVIIPKFCLWELLLVFKGKFKTATRRFFSHKGRNAKVEGVRFTCWYYNPGFVVRALQPHFDLVKLEGLCTLVPPSYLEGFAEKHPRLFRFLVRAEEKQKAKWPWRAMGDYFIISFRKKP